jgi:hypothetical protein
MTKWIAGLGLSAALAFAAPSTSEAQGPVVTGGLVNVTIVDAVDVTNVRIIRDITVAAAVQLAANICGVAVNVIAIDFQQDGKATCETAAQTVTITQQRGKK